jgi:hypothetical protein
MDGGMGVGSALAFWLNASITAKRAAESSANLLVGITFSFMSQNVEASPVPKAKQLMMKCLKCLFINELVERYDLWNLCDAWHEIVKYSDDS